MRAAFPGTLLLASLLTLACGGDSSTNPSGSCDRSPLAGIWERLRSAQGTTTTETLEFRSDCSFVLTYCCEGPDCADLGCTTEEEMTFEDRGETVRISGEPGSEVNEVAYSIQGDDLTMRWDEGPRSYRRQ
ncbi:MAG: hypothetical protein ACE15D_19010 [Candidatus Eisenbacteria bacterium]